VVCGAEEWADIENIGNSKIIWLKTYLEMPKGIPVHDIFWGVFIMEIGSCHERRSLSHTQRSKS
jgi:hypothetical protein